MADDEQNQQPPRYWFPYWSGVPQPPPPPRPPRPAVRPQLSRRLSPPSPAAAPSSPRRPSPSQHRQPATTTTATRGAAPPTPPQSQVSRPSPSRSSPLGPIREPPSAPASNNSNAGGAAAPAPAKPPSMPAVLLLPVVPEAAPRQKDVDVVLPPERPAAQVQQPAAAEIKPHGHVKAADKEHKLEEKEKVKKDEHKSKDKEKEKDHKEKKDETKSKEKEKEKDKKHHAGDDGKHKEAKADQGKLHREIKAGVADMVHKASGSGHAAGSGTSVITLAGENKGASMKVSGGKSKDGGEWHGGHGHRLDGRSGSDGKKAAGKPGMMTALTNSNVQVINNSLLLQSSCSGGNPGVHLKFSAKSNSKDKQKHAGGGDKAAAAVGKK